MLGGQKPRWVDRHLSPYIELGVTLDNAHVPSQPRRQHMSLSDFTPIATAVLSGFFLLVGYVVQKKLESTRAVAEKRRETYSMFIKSTLASTGARGTGKTFDASEEIFWKAQVLLYGSDEVIRALGDLQTLLPRTNNAPTENFTQTQTASAFDALIASMRNDITPKNRVNAQELRRASPFY